VTHSGSTLSPPSLPPVYEWCMKEFKREKEHVLKGCVP
jgi:hypothetical protein